MIARFLLVAALAVVAADPANAWAIHMTHRNPLAGSYGVSDTATFDVFLDADPGLTLLSVSVLYDPIWTYDPVAAAALPASGAAGPGAQPSYILYTPGGGPGDPATILYPQPTPAFLNWPTPPPGKEQVNINYAETAFNMAAASGTGIWIGSLVFHLSMMGFGVTPFELTLSTSSNILQTGTIVVPPSAVSLSAPINLQLPEPTAALMIALAFLGTRAAVRWRRTRAKQ